MTVTANRQPAAGIRPVATSLPARLAVAAGLAVHALPHLMGIGLTLSPPTAAACAADPAALGCAAWLVLPTWLAPVLVVGWSVGAIAFLVLAWAVLAAKPWAGQALLITAVGSLALCALNLPGAQYGLGINLAIIAWVAVLALIHRRAGR